MVLMLNLSEAYPRWRHWRDAASATRQAKSGDGGHDLSECQAPEVRCAAVSHQESCCSRFEPVRARAHLERSVSMLLPPLQGTSTGAARSMPGLRAAERRVLLAPGAPAEFLLLAGFTPTVGSQDHTSRSDPEVKTWAPLDVENKMHRSAMMVDHNCGERFVQEWRVIAVLKTSYILYIIGRFESRH